MKRVIPILLVVVGLTVMPDGVCEAGEDAVSCPADCSGCQLLPPGDPCDDNSQCCSGNCKGKTLRKTCK